MKNQIKLFLFLIFTLLIVGCKEEAITDPEESNDPPFFENDTYYAYIRVNDNDTGDLLSNATITYVTNTLKEKTGTTNSAGKLYLEVSYNSNSNSIQYSVRHITKSGYQGWNGNESIDLVKKGTRAPLTFAFYLSK